MVFESVINQTKVQFYWQLNQNRGFNNGNCWVWTNIVRFIATTTTSPWCSGWHLSGHGCFEKCLYRLLDVQPHHSEVSSDLTLTLIRYRWSTANGPEARWFLSTTNQLIDGDSVKCAPTQVRHGESVSVVPTTPAQVWDGIPGRFLVRNSVTGPAAGGGRP